MFLDALIRRNEPFVRAAVELHQVGAIPANSYVLDTDAIAENAQLLAQEAERLGLRMYAMTKQLGRNPAVIRQLGRHGLDACVAVDMSCVRAIGAAGATVGNLGHLVQVPRHEAAEAARVQPEHWTVFSHEKAREASDATHARGGRQRLLARVHGPGDMFYPGHEGGFASADILADAERLAALPACDFAGVTTFPALLLDRDARTVRATPNLATLAHVAAQLERAGHRDVAVNAPGTTSLRSLATLASAGATQVEPGHALTGTTPWHALEELPERPAMLYLTEISHRHAGRAYCFGGGLYVDPVLPDYQVTALVGADADAALGRRVAAELPPAEAIDYYGRLDAPAAAAGDSVVFGFRAQAFVTRAHVVPVAGVASGEPRVEGVWTTDGRATEQVPA